MKFAVIAILAIAVIGIAPANGGPRCQFGRVQGFISVRSNPEYLVGTIPAKFTSSSRYFQRRYNCLGAGAQIRRVDTGVYDVRLPGLGFRTAFVTAISQEGVATSVQAFPDYVYRVALRGPLINELALKRRDVAFSIAVF